MKAWVAENARHTQACVRLMPLETHSGITGDVACWLLPPASVVAPGCLGQDRSGGMTGLWKASGQRCASATARK